MDIGLQTLADLLRTIQEEVTKANNALESVRGTVQNPETEQPSSRAIRVVKLTQGMILAVLVLFVFVRGTWPRGSELLLYIVVGLALLGAVGVVVYAYAHSRKSRRVKRLTYQGIDIVALHKEMMQADLAVKTAAEWTMRAGATALTEPHRVAELTDAGRSIAEQLRALTPQVYRLGSVAAILQADAIIATGRRRLARMKSTAVCRSLLDEKLCRTAVRQGQGQSGGLADVESAYVSAWQDARAMLKDGEENLDDYRYDWVLWAGGILWTAIVAVATWLLTK